MSNLSRNVGRRFCGTGSPNWCCRTGLNCRPLPYQGSALPLSYGSMRGRQARENRPKSRHGRPVLATSPLEAQARETPKSTRQPESGPVAAATDPRRAGFGSPSHGVHNTLIGRSFARLAYGTGLGIRPPWWRDRLARMMDRSGKGDSRKKATRQDRLKLALRENLKRRKAQEKERGKLAETPSSGHQAQPTGQVGKSPD